MAAYLTVDRFKQCTVMPSSYIDLIEAGSPGWTLTQLEIESDRLNARLSKRYAVPFAAPVPPAVEGWVTKIVTLSAYLKRGFDPTDQQGQMYVDDRNTANAEIKEAADAEYGLFDLPLRADTTASGISKAGPRAYSEQSPYAFTTQQGRTGRQEDENGGGTFT